MSSLVRGDRQRLSARARATAIGIVVLVVAVVVGLLVGPVRIGTANVLRWMFSFGNPPQRSPTRDRVRPRRHWASCSPSIPS